MPAWIPYALGAGVVALVALSTSKASADEGSKVPTVPSGIKPGQKVPPGAPTGSDLAEVKPKCGSGNTKADIRCRNGMVLRKAAGVNSDLIAPEDDPVGSGIVSPLHARAGTLVAVLSRGHKAPGEPAGYEWWEVLTDGGGHGFTRAVGLDPMTGKVAPNFILIGHKVGEPGISGQGTIIGALRFVPRSHTPFPPPSGGARTYAPSSDPVPAELFIPDSISWTAGPHGVIVPPPHRRYHGRSPFFRGSRRPPSGHIGAMIGAPLPVPNTTTRYNLATLRRMYQVSQARFGTRHPVTLMWLGRLRAGA